jgi:hypothetical protein
VRKPKLPPWTGCGDTSGDTPCAAPVHAIVTLHGGEIRRTCQAHAIELDDAGLLQAARRVVV